MKKTVIAVVMASVLAAAFASAHDGHKHAPKATTAPTTAPTPAPKAAPLAALSVKEVQLVGELIDPQCWFTHDGQGADHRECAVMCAEGGQGLALFESKTGRLYPIIAASHGVNPNKGLIEHVAVPVRVNGTLFSRGPNHALLVQNVQRVGPRK